MITVLKRLRLSPVLHTLPDRLVYARKTKLSHQNFLELVLQDEVDRREHKSLALRIHKAGFDEEKTLEDFDWDAPVTFDRDRVRDLFSLGFLDRHEDVLFMGPVGVGKTFLADALGPAACRAGKQVLSRRADELFKDFLQARADHSTSKTLRRYLTPHLLIIDDFGLRRLDARQSSDIYEVIIERHKHAFDDLHQQPHRRGVDSSLRRSHARPERPRPLDPQRLPGRHRGRELPKATGTRRPICTRTHGWKHHEEGQKEELTDYARQPTLRKLSVSQAIAAALTGRM